MGTWAADKNSLHGWQQFAATHLGLVKGCQANVRLSSTETKTERDEQSHNEIRQWKNDKYNLVTTFKDVIKKVGKSAKQVIYESSLTGVKFLSLAVKNDTTILKRYEFMTKRTW